MWRTAKTTRHCGWARTRGLETSPGCTTCTWQTSSLAMWSGEYYPCRSIGNSSPPSVGVIDITILTERITSGVAFNPGSSTNGSWQPIPLLSRNDSIVAAYNVLTNNLNYLDPVFDPLFLASGVNNDTSSNRTIYFGDYFATTLVCLDQFQYCNPLNGRCTAETYDLEASKQGFRGLGLNDYQKALVWRVGKAFAQTFTFDSGIGVLGVSGEWLLTTQPITLGVSHSSLLVIGSCSDWKHRTTRQRGCIRGHLVTFAAPRPVDPRSPALVRDSPRYAARAHAHVP